MKFAMYIVMLLVAICALFADAHALPKHRPRLPGGPGYGPFNPRQPWPIPLPIPPKVNILNQYLQHFQIRKIFDFPNKNCNFMFFFLYDKKHD